MSVKRETILVVDDDESVERLECAQLERAGYRVRTASSAAAALEIVRKCEIDLAVVDMQLEDPISGLELLADFQSLGMTFPVIIVTAHSEEATIIHALRAGVSDFIPKTAAYLDYLPEAVARVLKQRCTEQRLAESEARFVSFMDNGPALCFIKDAQGRFLFANRQLREMFAIDDWSGITVFDIVPPDLAQLVHQDDQEAIHSGAQSEKRYRAFEPGGLLREWLTYRFPIRDMHGRPLMGGVCVDVSEATRSEEALRTSEAKFRSVSESATDAIIAMDQNGRVVSWNSAATRMFGYTADEMLGQSLECIMPARYRTSHRGALADVVTGGQDALSKQFLDLHALRRDGTEFPVELSIGSWQVNEERFFCGIIRDTTERKRTQEKLHQREEQLRHSQKLEALGTLAGGVAHEFNNLLQSIQGYTRYACEGLEPNDTRRQDLDLVLQAAERAATLTRQLLGFSRRQLLQFVDLDPNQVVQEAARMLRPLIGAHIRLELSLGENVGAVHADPTHLHQLLMNLAVNARDAMPRGGQLLIKTAAIHIDGNALADYPELTPGEYLTLTVSDTGCGMTAEVLKHAFDPFFTTKEVGKGTGLGLPSVYGVVTQHRGTVRVTSTPGRGTCFTILLPIVNRPTSVLTPQRLSPQAREGETILLAEDEPLVRDLMQRTLERAGYRTICVSDGEEALEVFQSLESEISLVMLDLVMPRVSGREVYASMRAIDPEIKVIFTSAYDLETAQLGIVEDESLRFVQKPCDAPVLLRVLREMLDGSRPGTSSQTSLPADVRSPQQLPAGARQ
jgi:PAS domain S-box-containing protein